MFDPFAVLQMIQGNAVHLVISIPTEQGQIGVRAQDLANSLAGGTVRDQVAALRNIADIIEEGGKLIPASICTGGITNLQYVEAQR